jgi:hypothetical protein
LLLVLESLTMKKSLLLIALLVPFAIPQIANADLVAGWNEWSTPAADVFAAGTTATFDKSVGTWGNNFRAGSDDGTFGDLLAGADTTIGNSAASHSTGTRSSNNANATMNFTIVDTSGVDRDLEFFHFDAVRRHNSNASTFSLEILAGGSLTAGFVAGDGTFAGGVSHENTTAALNNRGEEVSLTGLSDFTLDANGSVTFQLTFLQATGNNNHLDLDNVGVSAVPEPSSFAVLSLCGLAFLRRRK